MTQKEITELFRTIQERNKSRKEEVDVSSEKEKVDVQNFLTKEEVIALQQKKLEQNVNTEDADKDTIKSKNIEIAQEILFSKSNPKETNRTMATGYMPGSNCVTLQTWNSNNIMVSATDGYISYNNGLFAYLAVNYGYIANYLGVSTQDISGLVLIIRASTIGSYNGYEVHTTAGKVYEEQNLSGNYICAPLISDESTQYNECVIIPKTTNNGIIYFGASDINIYYYCEGLQAITSISIATPPTKINYFEGESFSPAGMAVRGYFSNGTNMLITNYTYTPNGPLSVNDSNITISYQGKTATQAITVTAVELLSISVTTPPTKITYVEGHFFDPTGMIVTGYYNNGSNQVITNYNYAPQHPLTLNNTSIHITYQGKTTTQHINIIEFLSIYVRTLPNKTNYIEGELFDPTGMIVIGTYSNDVTRSITGYSYEPRLPLTSNDHSITVSFTDGVATRTTTFGITVNDTVKNLKLADSGQNPQINFAIGRVIYEHADMSIGGGNYEINVSHIYNSNQTNNDNIYGIYWRLNTSQKIYRIDNETYHYVDSTGDINVFVLFDSENNRYYNSIDARQVLTVPSNDLAYISDDVGNKIYFNSDGSVARTVSGLSANIVKKFEYDSQGRIIRIYDNRLKVGNRIRSFISFTYNATNGLLESITAYDQYVVAKSREAFEYDTINGNRLIKINREAFNPDGDEWLSKTIKEFYYHDNGYLKAIIDTETKSASVFYYNNSNRISKSDFGVIQDEEINLRNKLYSEQTDSNGNSLLNLRQAISGLNSNAITLSGGTFLSKRYNAYTYYSDNENTYKTVVENENGIKTAFYLDTKYRIVSQFEQTNDDDLKVQKKESGTILNIRSYISMPYSEQYINGNDVCSVNELSFDVDSFDLSHYTKNENKYFDCSFWLKHDLDEERLKIKFEYKLTGDINYRTEYAWINGRAKNAWQKASVLITLDADNDGKYDSTSLKSCRITLCYASGDNAGSFLISYLLFNPAPKVVTAIRDGNKTFPINSIDRFYSSGRTTTYEIINNQVATDTYLTEDDILRRLMNKFGHPVQIGSYSYFDIICNDGMKRLPYAWGFVFERNGVTCNLTNVFFPIVTDTTEPTNKVNVKQYYHFESDKFTINSSNYYKENGLGGDISNNDHSSSNNVIYDYRGLKLSEKDEYGLKTEYHYDDYGQLIRTQKVAPDGTIGEISEAVYDENNENIKTAVSGFDGLDYGYLSPFANIIQTTQKSFDNSTNIYSNAFNIKKTTYDAYNDKVTCVEQYNGSQFIAKNDITYENGRIRTVTDGYVKYGARHDYVNDKMEYTRFSGADSNAETVVQTDTIERIGENKLHKSIFNGIQNNYIATTEDKYGRVKKVHEGPIEKVSYNYPEQQNFTESEAAQKIMSITDNFEGRETTFNYDAYNNLIGWTKGINHLNVSQITSGDTKYIFGENEKYCTRIGYDAEKVVSPRVSATRVSYDPNNDNDDDFNEIREFGRNYEYDKLGRLTSKQYEDSNNKNMRYDISYLNLGQSHTKIPTGHIYSMAATVMGYNLRTRYYINQGESYTYDKRGNILNCENFCQAGCSYIGSVNGSDSYANESQTKSYEYDEINRLTKEQNSRFGTREYTYGANGKIINVRKDGNDYPVTYNALIQLSSYNGASYTYDGMGNRSTKTVSGTTTHYSYVRGNLLSGIGSNTYYYNVEGVRFKKKVDNVETTYYLDGNKILGEDRETKNSSGTVTHTDKLRYFYDIDGLCGVRYNGTNYEYVRNAYGDVVMIVKDKIPVARYYYDAWGNCQVEKYGYNNIGDINPFRWKSHYYDSESELYYANGSYYDPAIGQHVDAVKLSSIIENAFTLFGLDINGIMCDNILAYLPYIYTIITTMELSPDPTYDPDANKPWWELAWNAVVKWLASVVQWFHNLDIGWKIAIGVTLFAIACIITYFTGGAAAAAWAAVGQLTLQFMIGVVSATAISMVLALVNGESVSDAFVHGLADGIFWGGVFAFVSASVNAVKTGVRAIKNAKLASSPQSGSQPCSTVNQCFITGTLVACLDEQGNKTTKPIEDIKVGDKVLAYDEETGEQAYKSVVRLFRNETKEWYHIHVNGEEIVCTGGHPFYVVGQGFVEARSLKEFDKLLLSDGNPVTIDSIEVEKLPNPETTYNFEVEDFHTYYVTDSKVLVHNKCYLDPKDINYTQDSISNTFRDGSKVDDMIEALKSGALSPDDVPALEVFMDNGKIYSINNRRLFALKMAGVEKVPVKWVSKISMNHPFTGNGLSVVVRGGSKFL